MNSIQQSVVEQQKRSQNFLYVSAHQQVLRKWAKFLRPVDSMVLLFVMDRTLPFGKTRELIPYSHFLDGVRDRTGVEIVGGLNVSRRTLQEAIKLLRGIRLLTITDDKRPRKDQQFRTAYWFEIDFKNLFTEPTVHLKLPKSLKNKESTLGKNCPRVEQNLPIEPIEDNQWKKNYVLQPAKRGVAGEAKANVQRAADIAMEKSKTRRAARAAKVSQKMTRTSVNAAWTHIFVEMYPKVPCVVLTEKEWYVLRSRLKTYTIPAPIPSFLEWLCREWTGLRTVKFKWLRRYDNAKQLAVVPSIHDVSRYLPHFVTAFGEHLAARGGVVIENFEESHAKAQQELAQTKEIVSTLSGKIKTLEDQERRRAMVVNKNPKHSYDQFENEDEAPRKRRTRAKTQDDLGEWKE